MVTGIIDVGGGFRAIYSAGVLDKLMDLGIKFDHCYGVSAGSGNLTSYLSNQRGRNYVFYVDYANRKEYMSKRNFLKYGSFINLDYPYSNISSSSGENPLDYPALRDNPATLTVVACDSKTGNPVYFTKDDISQDNYDVIKASSSLPVVNKPYKIGDRRYFDGGLTDPIPFRKAFSDGCDKVVIILTRPKDYLRKPDDDKAFSKILSLSYPNVAEKLRMRYRTYNEELLIAREYEKEGKVLILAPTDICNVSTLKRSEMNLLALYRKGLHDGEKVMDFLGE